MGEIRRISNLEGPPPPSSSHSYPATPLHSTTTMPFTFHCSKRPPPFPLPPIPIPGMDGVMSNDGVAVVFNLDPRLQESKRPKHRKMAPREGGFLDSLRASFSSKTLRTDNKLDSRTTFYARNDKRRREKGKERERDLSFIVLPRSSSSLIPDKNSNSGTTMSPPPLPRREDRLPKHANVFTGIPTPTESAITSARNSQHALSKPGTPVNEHSLRPSRSVPDWTSEQRRQYRYFQDAAENELPRMPSAYEPRPTSNPGVTAEEVGILERVTRGGEIARDNSPMLSSIGRYKKKREVTASGGDELLVQQRSSMKPHKSLHRGGNDGPPETPDSFLVKDGPGNSINGHSSIPVPARKQLLQQRPDHCPNPQNALPQHQIRRRSTAPAGATDDDQRRTSSTSQHRLDRPTSTSTYQAHRGHLHPVAEETPPSIPVSKWSGDWSPHLQQGSELFFETGMGADLGRSASPVPGTPPLVEMGVPSPQAKARPASWACPIRPVVGGGLEPAKSGVVRHSHELDILFPPTPPSSTGDVWDDCTDLEKALREHHLFWEMLRHSWNVFILIWALLLIFKSVQFIVKVTEVLILEPVKFLGNILRNVAEN